MNTKLDPNISRHNIPKPVPGETLGHLPSGYDDSGGAPSETFTIPSCGIEDCDKALHGLFNDTIKFSVQTYGAGQQPIYLKKPQVIFATGEKFALAKKLRPPRDKNQVLILPAISIRRMSIEQTAEDITGRGMNQFTGDIVIKRRLAPNDRDFQTLLNKYAFRNLPNLPRTTGESGGLANDPSVMDGVLLEPHLGNNIFEIFTIPQPQFFTATYDVVFWTNYHAHMNYMIETLMSSFLPQDRMFRLGTDKGYWFMAYVDESMSSQDNFDDFSSTERIIRYNFTVRVKGFVLAPDGPANPVPVRRYLSAPKISFEINESSTGDILSARDLTVPPLAPKDGSQFMLSDIDVAPAMAQTPSSDQRLLFKKTLIDPISGKKKIKYVRQTGRNTRKGESSFRASDVKTLQEFLLRDDE